MLFNVFENINQAQACEAYDFEKEMNSLSDNNGYDSSVSSYAMIRERIDGKFVYKKSSRSDSKYIRILCIGDNDVLSQEEYNSLSPVNKALYQEIVLEEFSSSWFPQENIE